MLPTRFVHGTGPFKSLDRRTFYRALRAARLASSSAARRSTTALFSALPATALGAGDGSSDLPSPEEVQAHPLLFEPFPPEIVGRETTLFIGRNTAQTLIQQLLENAGIRASPRQMDELFRHIKGPQERLDKGESQMTFYQVKKLMKDLLKSYTMWDFWRLVEQVTRQKPKLQENKKKSASKTD